MVDRRRPGEVRDAIRGYLAKTKGEATVAEIRAAVARQLGEDVPASSVRSALRLSDLFAQRSRGTYRLSSR
jgi:hypothetical protein